MEIRLFGPVEIRDDDGRPARLERTRERATLAALALQPGKLVSAETLIGSLWDGAPPGKARETLATYARTVRAALVLAGAAPDVLTNRRLSGYELHLEPGWVDYHRFTALVRDAAQAVSPADSVTLYVRALAIGHGDPLADVDTDWAERRAYRMRGERTDASCALFRCQLEIGAYADAAAGVSELLAEVTPTDEIIAIGLEALAHSGRHAEIDQFMNDAEAAMWRAAAARPGDSVRALAARLVARPPAANRSPQESRESYDPGDRVRQSAINCGTVYIAGGDQYVSILRHR